MPLGFGTKTGGGQIMEIIAGTVLKCVSPLPGFLVDFFYEVGEVNHYRQMGTEVRVYNKDKVLVTFQNKDPHGAVYLGSYFDTKDFNNGPIRGAPTTNISVNLLDSKTPHFVESKHAEWIKNTITAFLSNYEHLSQQERETIIKFIQSLENPKLIIPNNE